MLGLQPLVGKHRAAYNADLARINVFDGAVRSGKTITSLLRWVKYVRSAPPGILMMVGKTERTLKQNCVDPLLMMLGKHARYSAGSGEMTIAGRRILVVGANDERAEGKIRGVTLAGAYGDELTLWPENFFQMLMSRLSVEGSAFIGTTNPDTPAHWLNKQYLKRAHILDLARWKFTLEDNPYLPASYVENLKKEYTGLWYRRFILGDWVMAEGSIFDMLDPDRHLVASIPPTAEQVARLKLTVPPMTGTYAGGDYGTTNPTVYLALSHDAERFYVHDEWRWDSKEQGRQKTDSEYSQAYLAWKQQHEYPIKGFFVDPAAASFILQIHRDGEKRVVGGDNHVLDGIRDVSSLLGSDLMVFHEPTTAGVWEEMLGYVWDPEAQKRGIDQPLKTADHGPDALRYAVRGTRSIWHRYLAKETARNAAA